MDDISFAVRKLKLYIKKKGQRASLILHDNGEGCVVFDLYSEHTQRVFEFENVDELIKWIDQPLTEEESEKYNNRSNNRESHNVGDRHQKYNKEYTFKRPAEPSYQSH